MAKKETKGEALQEQVAPSPDEELKPPEQGEEAPEVVEPPGPPKGERFVCNRYPSYKIGVGHRMIEFQNGEFVTDDPGFIEAIKADPCFNLFIIPDNPEWRKRRR